MSYNILNGKQIDGKTFNYERQISVIRGMNADLVTLDEVDSITERSKGHFVLREYAAALGMQMCIRDRHKVELTNVGPVSCSAYGAHNSLVKYYLLQFVEVNIVHGFLVTGVQSIALLFVLNDTLTGGAEFLFVKRVSETFAGFSHFLGYFLVVFCYLVLNEHIGTVTFLGIAVVDERVIECVYMSGGFPHCGVHENSCVYANYVLVKRCV